MKRQQSKQNCSVAQVGGSIAQRGGRVWRGLLHCHAAHKVFSSSSSPQGFTIIIITSFYHHHHHKVLSPSLPLQASSLPWPWWWRTGQEQATTCALPAMEWDVSSMPPSRYQFSVSALASSLSSYFLPWFSWPFPISRHWKWRYHYHPSWFSTIIIIVIVIIIMMLFRPTHRGSCCRSSTRWRKRGLPEESWFWSKNSLEAMKISLLI